MLSVRHPENRRDTSPTLHIVIFDAFWPFFTSIVDLLAAMVQFARIILVPPEA
jgi:hypothetical protein